ncbi:MAG: NAD(P)/FAD-dependent oxidoreductase [Caulobacteraceae bacterium]
MADPFDVLIIGAGIAGASLAASLPAGLRVALIEREAQAGYHATGRSAALFSQIYGNAAIRALSRASRAFLFDPPTGFAPAPLAAPRGALYIARPDQRGAFEAMAALPDVAAGARPVSVAEARRLSPLLREGYVDRALHEDDARDIDVNALHQGYLRRFGAGGGTLRPDAAVLALERVGSSWRVATSAGELTAPVVVNAAGAWADQVGAMAGAAPIGLTPRRRTAVLAEGADDPAVAASAMTIDIDERFYFKPDAGLLLLSPADETPVEACDAAPEEIDVALAIDRVERATTLKVRRVRAKWAGLRSFVADRAPVVGFDSVAPGFFWLAGQGGYGIQTAPAIGALAAALVVGEPVPADLVDFGLDVGEVAPQRLGARAGDRKGAVRR